MTKEERKQRARAAYKKFLAKPGNEHYNRDALRDFRRRTRLSQSRPRRTKRSHNIEYGPLPYTIQHDWPTGEGMYPLSPARARHEESKAAAAKNAERKQRLTKGRTRHDEVLETSNSHDEEDTAGATTDYDTADR